MTGITNVTYQSGRQTYDFVITQDGDHHYYMATCDTPDGGINALHKDIGKLMTVEIPDAVRVWEEA